MIKVFKPVSLAVLSVSLLCGNSYAWNFPSFFRSAKEVSSKALVANNAPEAKCTSCVVRRGFNSTMNAASSAKSAIMNNARNIVTAARNIDPRATLDSARLFACRNRKVLLATAALTALGGSLYALSRWMKKPAAPAPAILPTNTPAIEQISSNNSNATFEAINSFVNAMQNDIRYCQKVNVAEIKSAEQLRLSEAGNLLNLPKELQETQVAFIKAYCNALTGKTPVEKREAMHFMQETFCRMTQQA